MRYLRWILISLAVVFGLSILAFLGANAVDETLDEEAAGIIRDAPGPTPNGTRAFYYFLGLRSGDTMDPEGRGKEIWNSMTSVPMGHEGSSLAEILNSAVWPHPSFPLSFTGPASQEWLKNQDWRDGLEKARSSLALYLRLLEYGEFTPLRPLNPFSMNTGAQLLLKGHRWLDIHRAELVAQGKWTEAERLVRLENRFQEKFFLHGYLLDSAVAHTILHDNSQFLKQETKANPRLKVSRETKESFQFPEPQRLMESALRNELRHYAGSIRAVPPSELAYMIFGSPEWLRSLPLGITLQPNETVNRYMQFVREIRSIRCPDGSDECYPSMRWSAPTNPMVWFRNPMGRIMFRSYASNITRRMEKTYRRDGEIREVLSGL